MAVRVNWREDAACLDADPDLFFPIASAGPALEQIDEAKRICMSCPVRRPCLAWALDQGVVSGIWGGTSEAERRALRRAATRYGTYEMGGTPATPSGPAQNGTHG